MLRVVCLVLIVGIAQVSAVVLKSNYSTLIVDPIGPYPGSDDFTWSPGVPSINLQVSVSNSPSFYLFQMVLQNSSYNIAYIRSARVYSLNRSLANISQISNTTYIISLGSSNSLQNSRMLIHDKWGFGISTLYIMIKGCSLNNNQWSAENKNKAYNFQEEAFSDIGCNNSIVITNTTSAVVGRKVKIVCGSDAQWIVPSVKCWNGSLLDFNKKEFVQTFMVGTKTLVFCDTEKQESKSVRIFGHNLFNFTSKKVSWVYVSFSHANHNQIVTCEEILKNSNKTTIHVKLDIQFPPLIKNGTKYESLVTVGEEASVELAFQSNPRIPASSGFITVTKNGSLVTNLYTKYVEVTNNLIFHFQKVSYDDVGDYSIAIRSGWPFYTTHDVTMTLVANEITTTTKVTTTLDVSYSFSAAVIGMGLVIGILVLVLIFGYLKMSGSFCFEKEKMKIDKLNEPTVRYNANTTQPGHASGQARHIENHNYEVPIPISLPNPPQSQSNTQNQPVDDIYENM